ITEKSVKVKSQGNLKSKKRLVIISDTHITHAAGAFNLHAYNVGIEKINKIKNATIYLNLGDITHLGTLLDYEYALEQRKKLDPISKSPIMELIGNHDAMNVGYLLFEEMIGSRHYAYEDEDIYIYGIDSTKPDLPGGIINHSIIESVRKKLEKPERENKFKVICFHHQLIPIPYTGKERSAIDDSGDMLKMLLEAKADLVLNGHRHHSNFYTVSSSDKDLFIINAGTFSCNKTRYRELFTYSIIDIEDNNLNYKVIPVLDSNSTREILREVNYYVPLQIEKNLKPIAKFVQLSNSLVSEQFEGKITNLDKAIGKINKIDEVDLVIHTGNLTYNSFKEEFKLAKDKLRQLEHPFIVVPGYTDSKPLAWEYWKQYFGDFNPLYENDKIYFQGMNSTTLDSKDGFIGRKKLNNFIDKVLSLSHQKLFGVCFFHNLIPTPLSVWRTELIDSGDVLSQFASSQIDLVLNSSPSISFNVKIDNTIFSNGGNLKGKYFDEVFIEIEIYKKGLVVLKEHNLRTGKLKLIGNYYLSILI
ncbi:MAG: metallophosphoesterase, partial [Candidatus Lokiarchaeota archaeon]|nr:metallophosphoesterase [Candidatus Lokiarchaeota archaeon]